MPTNRTVSYIREDIHTLLVKEATAQNRSISNMIETLILKGLKDV